MYLRQQLRAPNDSNGNPRRVWVLYQASVKQVAYSTIEATWDEGYEGDPVHLGGVWGQSAQLPSVDVPVSEYKRFVKIG